jgi:hypothetical protein
MTKRALRIKARSHPWRAINSLQLLRVARLRIESSLLRRTPEAVVSGE